MPHFFPLREERKRTERREVGEESELLEKGEGAKKGYRYSTRVW
jgi:hypothetical protein